MDLRLVPGRWEGDLIKGQLNQSRVGVLVERSALYVALVKLEDGSAQSREMAHHRWLEQQTGIEVYFAHPHSP